MENQKPKKNKTKPLETGKLFTDVLATYRSTINSSLMFQELCTYLEPYKPNISRIRCLAIGSFSSDFPAKYQLALLLELVEYLSEDEKKVTVSIFDPVFIEDDNKFMESLTWNIEENSSEDNLKSNSTLFFLPHAPLDLTENILKSEEPQILLANNIVQHTDRYTQKQLYDKFPIISKLVHLLNSVQKESNKISDVHEDKNIDNDGFTTFMSKKKKRNNRSKYRFTDPVLDYTSIETSFSSCQYFSTFDNGKLLKDKPWINSFSDLALHHIT